MKSCLSDVEGPGPADSMLREVEEVEVSSPRSSLWKGMHADVVVTETAVVFLLLLMSPVHSSPRWTLVCLVLQMEEEHLRWELSGTMSMG